MIEIKINLTWMSSMNYQRFSFKPYTLTNKDQCEQTPPEIDLVFEMGEMIIIIIIVLLSYFAQYVTLNIYYNLLMNTSPKK